MEILELLFWPPGGLGQGDWRWAGLDFLHIPLMGQFSNLFEADIVASFTCGLSSLLS